MAGVEQVEFFKERPEWLKKSTILDSEKITSEDLDFDRFISSMGFYQR